jgi:hypothetical protein
VLQHDNAVGDLSGDAQVMRSAANSAPRRYLRWTESEVVLR